MSELQEHQFCECDEYIREYRGPLSNEMRPYYLKSEADKVIAELKALKAQAEDDCAYWKSKAQRERHANYKRCLAMAKWCEMGISYWDDDEQEGGWEYKKLRHCIRWKKRWLELAEKFKEAEIVSLKREIAKIQDKMCGRKFEKEKL